MKAYFLEKTADGLLDLAVRAKALGHDVKYTCIGYHQHTNPVGRGLVEREADWRKGVYWADVTIVGGNDYSQLLLDAARKAGHRIVGSCVECEAWESDRAAGMAVMRAAGIPLAPYREFTDYDAAIAYVKRQDRAFASKPSGRCDDKGMSYVAKSPEDLVYMLERWKRAGKRRGEPFILQEKISGVEFAAGAWFGPGGFVPEWEENFEHKKLFPGDLGPNCYSADTEVLTDSGWKFWPDVIAADRIATLVDGKMTFEVPSQLVAAPFDGEMIAWQSNRLDLLVTPGHQMHVVDRADQRKGNLEFQFVPANVIAGTPIDKKYAVLRTSGWDGEKGPAPEMARMLGMFLADGYCKPRSIMFGNCPPHKQALIRRAALDMGLTAHLYGSDIYINSKWLANLCRDFPTATEKRAPREIMDAPPNVIAAFLDGLALDATTRDGNLTYTTASKGMADDIQIMAAKIGACGAVRERDRRDEPDRLLNGCVVRGSLSWEVGISFQSLAWLRPRFCKSVPYRGMVYCATVSSHVLYVRRNGKPCWNGQTGELGTVSMFVEKSKLAEQVLHPLEGFLARAGFVGCVDVSVIIDEDGHPWPLEFTTRGGWPALNLEAACFDGDFVEFFYGLAQGKPPDRVHRLHEVVCGIVLALPDFPYSHVTRKEVVGVPLYGIDARLQPHLHLAQVMIGDAPQKREERIETAPMYVSAGDYVAVVTGCGDTVTAARRKAYGHVKQISMPSGAFYRNDVGARLTKDVPKLQAHGYASSFVV